MCFSDLNTELEFSIVKLGCLLECLKLDNLGQFRSFQRQVYSIITHYKIIHYGQYRPIKCPKVTLILKRGILAQRSNSFDLSLF